MEFIDLVPSSLLYYQRNIKLILVLELASHPIDLKIKAYGVDEVLDVTCRLLAQALSCSRVFVLLAEPEDTQSLVVAGEFSIEDDLTQQGLQIRLAEEEYLQQLLTRSSLQSTIEAITHSELKHYNSNWLGTQNIQSMLSLIIYNQEQCMGMILAQCEKVRQWTQQEREIFNSAGCQLAVFIDHAKLYEETRRQSDREALFRSVISQIHNSLDCNTILQTAVQQVRQLLKTDRVVIYHFLDSDWRGEVVVEDVVAPWRSVLGEIGRDDCFSKKHAKQYLTGRVRTIPNILNAGLDECHVKFLQQLQIQANLIVPIIVDEQLWGLLIAHECRSPRTWQPWETELLEQLAERLAIAIQQSHLYQQIQQAATQSQTQTQKLQSTLEKLRTTQAQLIQNEKLLSLGQIAAGIAHEINNANNFIYANLPYAQQYAETLNAALSAYEAEYPPPVSVKQLEASSSLSFIRQDFSGLLTSMQEGTRRIREIVTTLKSFSRLDEAGFKRVDLHQGLEDTLVILKHRFKQATKLDKQYGDLPLVFCNPSQMNQVFLNLLNNALDAAGNPAEIVVRTWHSSDWVTIAIRDNGFGVPAEIQPRIFDPFFTTKEVGKGTGLGLFVVHQIVVQGHGGEVHCLNPPNGGAEFQVKLPLKA